MASSVASCAALSRATIYHRSPDRVRAHVFLCTLAYYVQWHMLCLLSDHIPALLGVMAAKLACHRAGQFPRKLLPCPCSALARLQWRRCLFDDHDREAGEQQRESVVRPAQRSPAAQQKAASKRTADDLPVHSFRGLLSDLGTLTANTVRMVDSGATFTIHSEPTALQQRCFDLLGVTARM